MYWILHLMYSKDKEVKRFCLIVSADNTNADATVFAELNPAQPVAKQVFPEGTTTQRRARQGRILDD